MHPPSLCVVRDSSACGPPVRASGNCWQIRRLGRRSIGLAVRNRAGLFGSEQLWMADSTGLGSDGACGSYLQSQRPEIAGVEPFVVEANLLEQIGEGSLDVRLWGTRGKAILGIAGARGQLGEGDDLVPVHGATEGDRRRGGVHL